MGNSLNFTGLQLNIEFIVGTGIQYYTEMWNLGRTSVCGTYGT